MSGVTRLAPIVPILAVALGLCGCGVGKLFGVNLTIVGEQTSLEKQVLGTYSALGQDLLAYSSVRGVAPDGSMKTAPPATESQRAAWAAMRNREYNRDDLERMLLAGYVGEGNDGRLALRNDAVEVDGLTPEEPSAILSEENADRAVVLERLRATLEQPTAEDIAEVAWIFARLNAENAPAGAWVQNRAGEWTRK